MSIYSNLIASRIFSRLESYATERRLGSAVIEALIILDVERDLRRRPDVAFVSAERWPLEHALPEEGDWQIVPDLAVEVTSPNDLLAEVLAKVDEYFHYGVRQVWLVVSPERQVYVYDSPTKVRILSESDKLSGGELIPGFELPLAALFRRQPACEMPNQPVDPM